MTVQSVHVYTRHYSLVFTNRRYYLVTPRPEDYLLHLVASKRYVHTQVSVLWKVGFPLLPESECLQ